MKRSTRRRMIAGAATTALLVTSLGVAVSGPASAAPAGAAARTCTISTLPYPTDTYRADANVIDPTGRYIAGTALRVGEVDNQYLLLFWDGQQVTEVEVPGMADPVDVNADGVVIGNGSALGTGIGQPWVYRDGTIKQLPVLPSTGIFVSAINDAGDIVGYGSDIVPGEYSALRWPAARPGTVEVLKAPANAEASGITDNGTIVGSAGPFGDWNSWVRRPNGRIDALTFPGADWSTASAAAGRWAIGLVGLDDTGASKVRWDLRNGSHTLLDQEIPALTDVNAKGVVVGGDRVGRGSTSRVLPGGAEGVAVGARSISDTGTIVGFRNVLADRVTPVRWTGC
ncbi:hypothetical protein [Micromonospora chokoriensis]|uniref:Extracellular repeat, HAF family n=1 Tax=Micromonospora chokoriensis TaxID=356851 RepID=A0A1C4UKK0_9ACTN|nr:hypothetical protein [Micromonospora chokoriensis]SCE72157.1 hypothetical protein GA0070612_0508 [Micromonospora chokoriensis]